MPKLKATGSVGLRNNKVIFATIIGLMVIIFVGTFTLLKNIYQTETYYVLNTDIPTRTQVTSDMLSPIITSSGSGPKAALRISDIQAGYLFTKYPLLKGDILTASNVGGFEDISVGIPDTWVVTSFGVNADDAVGGRIKRGVYFDMMIAGSNGAYYPFVNMLALDTTVSLNNASSSSAADTQEAHSGQTTQYVVGLPPEDAAKLQWLMKTQGSDVHLLLSPRQNEYAPPQLAAYNGMFKWEGDTTNLGKGTDYTFTPLKRDSFGRPIETISNCSQGNAQVKPENCSTATPPSSSSTTTQSTTTSTSTPASTATSTEAR
jgi:hypothetical protein